jgi:NAD-dependent dihydropyrimidine dehydrogenase PreA subunit
MPHKTAIILSQNRDRLPEQEQLEKKILGAFEGRHDVKLTVVPHLYDLKGDGESMTYLRSVPGDFVLLSWLYPRSAYWVLEANGVKGRLGQTSSLPEEVDAPADPSERTIWCCDLREQPRAESVLQEVNRIVATIHGEAPALAATSTNGRPKYIEEATSPRWYPVIDYQRCGGCGECLNFCLFGVFGLDESEQLVVEQPDACRPGCPACARICPEGAIMFPQHDDPAIAGDPAASHEELKLDLSQLFSGADPKELAEAERRRALEEQKKPKQPPDALDDLVDRVDDLEL